MLILLSLFAAALAELAAPQAHGYVHLKLEARTSRDISPREGPLPAATPARDGEVEVDFYFKPGSTETTPIVRARYEVNLIGGGTERVDTGYRIARYQTTEEYDRSRQNALATVGRYISVEGFEEPPFQEVGLAASMTGTSAKSGFDLLKALRHILDTKVFEVNELTVVLPVLMYSGHIFDVAETEFRLVHVFEKGKRAFQLRRQYTAVARRVEMSAAERDTLDQLVGLCGDHVAGRAN